LALPSPLFDVRSPDWSVMVELMVFLPNTSPISSIGTEALMPVFTVTTILIDELEAPTTSVAPTGKAMRVTVFNGGAELTQVADNGAVVKAVVVYSVPAGNVCPAFNTVRAGIGAMM